MELNIKKYTISEEYSDIYNHNFNVIDSIGKLDTVNRLVCMLSRISGIDEQIVLLELKRYLMNSVEYYPARIEKSARLTGHERFELVRRIANRLKPRKRNKKTRWADVLIDNWSPGVMENFYGNRLIDRLNGSFSMDTMSFSENVLANIFQYIKGICIYSFLSIYTRLFFNVSNINVSNFLKSFVFQYLNGEVLGRLIKPKVIISGNDNGFPVILAKAAKSKLLLIQNAKKTLFSDATFKYADIFISMSDMEYSEILNRTGCKFGKIYNYGSIRLANYLEKKSDAGIKYDILWISDLELTAGSEETFGRYYSMRSEIEAIELLNLYAKANPKKKIAYKCRMDNELEILKGKGLLAGPIEYIKREQRNTYDCVLSSDIVLSTISSVVIEALGIQKKAGYVNMSGNETLNFDVRWADIEYKKGGVIELRQFIERISDQVPMINDHIKQSTNYIEDLLSVIKDLINELK